MAKILEGTGQTSGAREGRYLTVEDLCDRLPGTTPAYWADHWFQGTGPEFVKLSHRKVLYPDGALDEWLDARRRTSTHEGR